MEKYFGKYVGLTHAIGAAGFREIEAAIDDRKISFRLATGHGIRTESIATPGFHRMTDDEVREAAGPRLQEVLALLEGYRHATGNTRLFFLSEDDGVVTLFMRTGVGGVVLDPVPFFNEAAVALGNLDKVIAQAEAKAGVPGSIPRLAHGGRAPAASKPN